jgi:hypothetical protein
MVRILINTRAYCMFGKYVNVCCMFWLLRHKVGGLVLLPGIWCGSSLIGTTCYRTADPLTRVSILICTGVLFMRHQMHHRSLLIAGFSRSVQRPTTQNK